MFAKPFSLILVYIITIFNIVLLLMPVMAVVLPFVTIENDVIIIGNSTFQYLKYFFFLLCFSVSFLMLFYLVIDFIFGFSVRAALKGCVRYQKIKDYDFLTELFDQTKNKFGERNVKLYIKNSDEVNAYAVSSLGKKSIILTSGLINHYLTQCKESKDFLYALRSIIGHEMSHLVNKDFLPAFLIITNQKVTNLVSHVLYLIFNVCILAMYRLPVAGRVAGRFMGTIYSALNFSITLFNRFVVYNVYEFLRRIISRSIEYRCDRQSAKAFGGKNMRVALSMLGESGYFTLFSTHPGTKSRMRKVEKVRIKDSVIRAGFFDSLANYFALMFLVVICLYFAKQAKIDIYVRMYLEDHEAIYQKLSTIWNIISKLF